MIIYFGVDPLTVVNPFGTQGLSKDIRPGDIIFFQYADDNNLEDQYVRFFNKKLGQTSLRSTFYTHVELCTEIDSQGRAIITGADKLVNKSGLQSGLVRSILLEEKLDQKKLKH